MNKEQREKQLKTLSRGSEGKALREFFEEKITEMNDVSTIKDWDETMGRKIAIRKLRDIMKKLDILAKDSKSSAKELYN